MRMASTLVACVVMTLWASTLMAAEVKQDFKVAGWTCSSCSNKTISVVKKVEGVKEATADVDKGLLTVTFDDAKANPDGIQKAIKEAGYGCSLKEKDDKKG